MAELATIARPYAEALFEAGAQNNAFDVNAAAQWLEELAVIAGDAQMQELAANPLVTKAQLFDLIVGVLKNELPEAGANFLRVLLDNNRFAVLPEASRQFAALLNQHNGLSLATVWSAFPIDEKTLAELKATLEKRFGRTLSLKVEIDASLIGGIRVMVGDEVLDTSVKARLEQMKAALIA